MALVKIVAYPCYFECPVLQVVVGAVVFPCLDLCCGQCQGNRLNVKHQNHFTHSTYYLLKIYFMAITEVGNLILSVLFRLYKTILVKNITVSVIIYISMLLRFMCNCNW